MVLCCGQDMVEAERAAKSGKKGKAKKGKKGKKPKKGKDAKGKGKKKKDPTVSIISPPDSNCSGACAHRCILALKPDNSTLPSNMTCWCSVHLAKPTHAFGA